MLQVNPDKSITSETAQKAQIASRWPNRFAILLAGVTFPLIWVGGLVTTFDAGMAVPDWPGTYGYNLFAYPISTWIFGPWDLFIEHGHRLLGSLAGLITIGLLVSAAIFDKHRKWLMIASSIALVLVIAQGILGGVRVLAADRQIAKVHGCVGPAFFAYAFALIVFTSKYWTRIGQSFAGRPSLFENVQRIRFARTVAWTTVAFAYLQLVVGAHIRHVDVSSPPRFFTLLVAIHLLMAVVVLLHGLYLPFLFGKKENQQLGLRRPARILALLIFCQFMLGLGTWLVKYGTPAFVADQDILAGFTIVDKGMLQSNIVTAHVAIGSLIVGTAVFLSVRTSRVFWFSKTLNSSTMESAEVLTSGVPEAS